MWATLVGWGWWLSRFWGPYIRGDKSTGYFRVFWGIIPPDHLFAMCKITPQKLIINCNSYRNPRVIFKIVHIFQDSQQRVESPPPPSKTCFLPFLWQCIAYVHIHIQILKEMDPHIWSNIHKVTINWWNLFGFIFPQQRGMYSYLIKPKRNWWTCLPFSHFRVMKIPSFFPQDHLLDAFFCEKNSLWSFLANLIFLLV